MSTEVAWNLATFDLMEFHKHESTKLQFVIWSDIFVIIMIMITMIIIIIIAIIDS